MSAQTSLSAFDSASTPETDPNSAEDYDGLQAVAASVSVGFSTTQEREDRSLDRIVDEATCRCGRPYDGPGLCPDCQAQADVVDDPNPIHTIGGGER